MHNRHRCLVRRGGNDGTFVEAIPLDLPATNTFAARHLLEEEAPVLLAAAHTALVKDGDLFCHDDSPPLLFLLYYIKYILYISAVTKEDRAANAARCLVFYAAFGGPFPCGPLRSER